MVIDEALQILKSNYEEWVRDGLHMVNVAEVESAMRFLREETPFCFNKGEVK